MTDAPAGTSSGRGDWTIPRDIGGVYPKAYEMLSVFEGACEYWRATGDPGVGASVRNLFTMILEREMTLVGNGGGDQPFHPDVYGEAFEGRATKPGKLSYWSPCRLRWELVHAG
jgi:hypothetical protein